MNIEKMGLLQDAWGERANKAQAAAAQAYERLLVIAERSDTGQAARVARFVAATFDPSLSAHVGLDAFALRVVDVEISDDMLTCLDAVRWGRLDLHKLIPDGHARVVKMCELWRFTGVRK
jgi:hypothetical protein